MSRPDVPTKHFSSPAAIQADDIVAMNRAADGHGRRALDRLLSGFPKITQRAVNIPDKQADLIRRELMAAQVRGHDLGCITLQIALFFV
jgi:hypothetical protein